MNPDILQIARDSGMLVLLEGRIGHEEYTSVSGSVSALSRFARSIMHTPMAGTRTNRLVRGSLNHTLVVARMRERMYRMRSAQRPSKSACSLHSPRKDDAPHHLNKRGPSNAPITVGTSMPSTYQTPQKGIAISGQCRQ
ncbi:hypothetical protein AWB66_05142 [Caballeronia telluris]|uniref:Uncharacterized protein n=1 Tax=Caballeronia telluris TaxID=326475 RepID=A0A158K1Z4_9BURK|nr:hypothetical protein AWB66_05142 [Caballeronia telluris]